MNPKVFVTGVPRSGTTLLHYLVSCFDELVVPQPEQEHDLRLKHFGADERRLLLKMPICHGRRPIDLSKVLRQEYGNFVVVYILRDPHEVLASIHPDFPDKPFTSPAQWATGARALMRCMPHPCLHLVRYERLIASPREEMKRLAEFVQCEPTDFSDWRQRVSTESHNNHILQRSCQIEPQPCRYRDDPEVRRKIDELVVSNPDLRAMAYAWGYLNQ